MLVLTRKLMEKLYIGDDICVTVVRLEGGQVRLGIEAPREVSVVRAELVPERLNAERGRAGQRAYPRAADHDDDRGPLRTPQALVRGTDSPHRGPSR